MNVVCYEVVCYEHGLIWIGLLSAWSVMNMVCYERGLLRTWSVMNVVCYERGLLWTSPLWTGL